MPSNSELAKNDKNREQTEHATTEDVPGGGQARRAADAVQSRKDRNRSALEAARRAVRGGK
jgi:hypothetical protein